MILTILRETATALRVDFGHGHEAYHNLHQPQGVYVWCLPLVFDARPDDAMRLATTYNLVMWFGKPNAMDSTALQLEEVTQEMEALCKAFVLRLMHDSRVREVSSVRGEADYHQLSMNATGVTVAFTVTVKHLDKFCNT
jgi:hypothetical protein